MIDASHDYQYVVFRACSHAAPEPAAITAPYINSACPLCGGTYYQRSAYITGMTDGANVMQNAVQKYVAQL